jgi:hypothetical protein
MRIEASLTLAVRDAVFNASVEMAQEDIEYAGASLATAAQ